jgi:iron complex outermembrane receptor protein
MACALVLAPACAHAAGLDGLGDLPIEDLGEVNVTSVSKTDQPLSEAAADIYVIDRDDILRSGAATLPEMLRLAPNLQVYESTPANWVVTARGLNGNSGAQSYSNKLLVLIDGRTVYTPLFSGVYWDLPDVLPDNIDRIEVISGPGATLWGANAVNGVINIITRDSSQTQGLYADVRAGPDRQALGLRVGGNLSDQLSYRVSGRWLNEDPALAAPGVPGKDDFERLGGNVRIDWTPSDRDQVALEGELFGGRDNHLDGVEDTAGDSVVLRWNRRNTGSEFQAQLFYDRFSRDSGANGNFHADTYDGEFQHSIAAGKHKIVWGAGARAVAYRINGTDSLFFDPPQRTLFIANGFVQDSWSVTPDLVATAGLKLEHLPFEGNSLLPEVRLAWKPSPGSLLWAAVSRAVRSPTPFDTDVRERLSGLVSLDGDPQFRAEKLTSFELGTRLQPAHDLSFSATLFLDRYDDLRTIELVPGTVALPLAWANNLEGNVYGIDASADWRIANWWSLSAGLTLLEQDLAFKPGSTQLLPTTQDGNDPPYYVTLRSTMNLGNQVSLDLDFRAVGALRGSDVEAYQELGGRLAWQISPQAALSLSGVNLLHDQHREYAGGALIPRRAMAGLELRF